MMDSSSFCSKLPSAGETVSQAVDLTSSDIFRNYNAKFSIDFHRCGKCLVEYESLEEFICHKISVHKCSLVLWESKKLYGIGLQIPSFIEFVNEKSRNSTYDETPGEHNDHKPKKLEVKKRRRGRPRKTEEKIKIRKLEDLAKSDLWKCCHCKLNFRNLNSLKFHRNQEHTYSNAVSKSIKACGSSSISLNDLTSEHQSTQLDNRLGITEYVPFCQVLKDKLPKDSTCPKCGNQYKDSIVLRTHLKTVHCDSRPYKCKHDCSLSFKTKGSLMRHMRRHTGERPYRCKKCNRSFRESGALTRHLKSRFPCSTKTDNDLARYGKTVGLDKSEPAEVEPDCEIPNSISTIKVIITDISEKSKDNHNNEIDTSIAPSIDCDLIVNELVGREIKEISKQNSESSLEKIKQSLSMHSKFGDSKDSQFEVDNNENGLSINLSNPKDVCESENQESVLEIFQEPSNQTEDLLIEDEDLKCLSCMQSFLNKLDLKSHLMLHLESLPFRCIQCCYVCQSKQCLVKHQRRKHGVLTGGILKKNKECEESQQEGPEFLEEDNNVQDIVKQLFRTQNSIEAEELEFSGLIKKPAKHSSRCHICLKRFSGSLYLGCHMGIHTGEKPFVCDICKKSFFLKDSLKKHTVCHSDERRYRCGECYKSFKRLSHVRDHLRIHSQLCPYQCNKCGKAFRWQGTLKSHELSHGGSTLKMHLCTTCGRRFPSKCSLVRHQRLHSSETANATQHLASPGSSESSFLEERTNKSLECLSETKIVCISENELVLRKQEEISIEEQDSTVSGSGTETYVLITQEDGSSCLVPTVAIVEEIQEGTAPENSIREGCS